MATVEELVRMMNTLQGQQHALNQEITRLTAENQESSQAGSPRLAEIATAVGQEVQTAIFFLIRTRDQLNDKVWSTLKVWGDLQRSRENLRESPSGSGDHGGF